MSVRRLFRRFVGAARCRGRAPRRILALLAPFTMLATPDAAAGQEVTERLWATVTDTAGVQVTGFLIWDLNEATRHDMLTAGRRLPEASKDRWLEWTQVDRSVLERSLEFNGVRLIWEEESREFPDVQEASIRFGHVARITPDSSEADVELRSGEVLRMVGSTSDLGSGVRGVRVEPLQGGWVLLGWGALREVRMGEPPSMAGPAARRLHGTVEARSGTAFTGWVTWDTEKSFATDTLEGRERDVEFGRISRIDRADRGVRVTLLDGEVLTLTGTDQGIEVSDPGLGSARIPWDEFKSLRLHDRDSARGAVDGEWGLRGALRSEAGDTHTGSILWDMEESFSWEVLDGVADGAVLRIEFAEIARIEKTGPETARVTLRDGRSLEVEDSADLGSRMRGILVTPDQGEPLLVDWAGFVAVDFEAAR